MKRMHYVLIALVVIFVCAGWETPDKTTHQQPPSLNSQTASNLVTATCFMFQLCRNGMLSGFTTNNHGSLRVMPEAVDKSTTYPITLKFCGTQNNETNKFHWFSAARTNEQDEWHVVKAWTTDEKGGIIEANITLPTTADQMNANHEILTSEEFLKSIKKARAITQQ